MNVTSTSLVTGLYVCTIVHLVNRDPLSSIHTKREGEGSEKKSKLAEESNHWLVYTVLVWRLRQETERQY